MINFGRMKPVNFLFAIAFLLLANAGCSPDGKTQITGGGKGGSLTVKIVPEYSNSFVDTCTVYVKYGTLDAPANGVYDDSVICTRVNDTSVAVFTGLTTGIYYFYGVGFHAGGGHSPNVRGAKNCSVSGPGPFLYYLPTYSYNP